jgi:hypothetical protein
METRALAIALFFAVGTAIGGITGPVLFGQFIHSGDVNQIAIGFFIGAAAMALGGVVELFFGIRAEQRSLEDIATPLTAEEAEEGWARERGEIGPAEPATRTAEEERILQRNASRTARDRYGLRRIRPGPGRPGTYYSPGMVGTAGTERRQLARELGARGWGPRRFDAALRAAVNEGRARRVTRDTYGPARTGDER